jgi:hypothetical protein
MATYWRVHPPDDLGTGALAAGRAIDGEAMSGWPAEVRAHVDALGRWAWSQPLLDTLAWDTEYWVDVLADEGVPMNGFSASLAALDLTAPGVRGLASELLRFAATTKRAHASREARRAGLWLWLWGSLGASVRAAAI